MAFSDWLSATADRVRTDGLSGVRRSGYELYLGGLRRALSVTYDPEYVWDRDWDVLLILDACRTDLMLEVADDYDYIDGVGEFTTAASSTTGWTEANFDDRFETEMATTGYVTGNPNSVNIGDHEFPDTCECGADVTPNSDERHQSGRYTCGSCETVIDGDRRHPFGEFVEAWRYNWDNDVGTIHPESVTSHAIEMIRETDLDRYIVHYNQPHQPFVDDDLGEQTRIAAEGAEKEGGGSNIWQNSNTGRWRRRPSGEPTARISSTSWIHFHFCSRTWTQRPSQSPRITGTRSGNSVSTVTHVRRCHSMSWWTYRGSRRPQRTSTGSIPRHSGRTPTTPSRRPTTSNVASPIWGISENHSPSPTNFYRFSV